MAVIEGFTQVDRADRRLPYRQYDVATILQDPALDASLPARGDGALGSVIR